jgi:hypothetical protein
MINLKVAEYNKDGKFQGFLELCKTQLLVNYNFEIEIDEEGFLFGKDCIIKISHGFDCLSNIETFYKDEKDPLKRFNGLFDGRTYGEGRFVLIQDEDFGVYEQKFFDKKHEEFGYGLNLKGNISCTFKNASSFTGNVYSTSPKLIGNLMENPELYEKIK